MCEKHVFSLLLNRTREAKALRGSTPQRGKPVLFSVFRFHNCRPYTRTPISDRLVGLRFPNRAGRCRGLRFRPRVVGVVDLWISDPGMGTYPPRGALAPCTSASQSPIGQLGWGFHTVRGGFDPRDNRFRSEVFGVVRYGRIYDPGMGPYRVQVALALFSSPSQSSIGRWGWGFRTVRGGVDPEDHHFRSRVVGVVHVWTDF